MGLNMLSKKPAVAILLSASLALASCAETGSSEPSKTAQGAVIGGILGGILGASRGGDRKNNALIGAAIGATAGAVIGNELDKQEQALRDSIGDGGAVITNTGSELIVTLPEDITFDTDSAEIRSSLLGDLGRLAQSLNEFPNTTVDIIGHTDNVGDSSYNQQLSAQRADAVRIQLINNGVVAHRIRAFGRGENEPKATNLNEEGRAQNRRVEIIIRPNA